MSSFLSGVEQKLTLRASSQDIYRQEENQMAVTPPQIAKTLRRDVLTKCGWAKTRGGGA